jgi:hypothetical protein
MSLNTVRVWHIRTKRARGRATKVWMGTRAHASISAGMMMQQSLLVPLLLRRNSNLAGFNIPMINTSEPQ